MSRCIHSASPSIHLLFLYLSIRDEEWNRANGVRTLSRFHGEDIYVSSLFRGVGIFLFDFLVSMALGVAFGLCCSLGLKHSHLATYPHIESCLVALVAYTSYFFSNGIGMSGEFHPPSYFQRYFAELVQVLYRCCSAASHSSITHTIPCRNVLSGRPNTCLQFWLNFPKTLFSYISV